MKSFHSSGRGFRSQWPRKTRQKKIAKSVVGKSIAGSTLEQVSDGRRTDAERVDSRPGLSLPGETEESLPRRLGRRLRCAQRRAMEAEEEAAMATAAN